ncbi:MAG TPA: bifunctional phosphopantothenoylcysteine decarboxylase/phosphopantothenate--cysteine ligase CoaBC [Actinomycetes bacterium]|jgi:phosphopantothenoylcysteine decarboxylase / phosphopantothenate---cysteine ligase|nr:bifunctional phosphopantothenoylcysteine decarboxylase/phosphopantothenate--cysteine ligase CoaBC [Actinomycetes bacterium]
MAEPGRAGGQGGAGPAPRPNRAALHGARVLLGVSGGIAAYKAAELARELLRSGAEVQPLLTAAGERMVSRATFAALTGRPVPASLWDDPAAVEHVALARWGQVLVVAPATAHTLARLAAGLADDLLTNVALAFPGPVVVAPAMHTEMWQHPATQANLKLLAGRGVMVVPPATGPLTSGDVGPGRLAELDDLVAGVAAALAPGRGLAGTRLLVSLGGTREPLDPVRYLGNRSSGRMGVAIVTEALRRGAEVTAVAAATTVDPPAGARLVRVETAQQLYDAVLAEAGAQDVIVMAAAVADFRPKRVAEGKLKKEQGVPEVVLEPTPDTLAELGRRRRPGQVLVGFAAETGDHLAGARRKLEAKHLDLVVLNHVEGARSAFGADDADASLVDAATVEQLPGVSKAAIAARLLDRVESLRAARS